MDEYNHLMDALRYAPIEEDALWKKIMKGEEENGSEMD